MIEGVARIRIERYLPFLCAAIHDGHTLRSAMAAQCRLTEEERSYEEDLYTGDLIEATPITVIVPDSRYEVDLNRPVSRCVYEEAWGKKVWKGQLPAEEVQRSQQKHRRFYDALDALVRELERRFEACLIFDVHTYNHQRKGPGAPTFNIGTFHVDLKRWDPMLRRLERALAEVKLPGIETRVARDVVFQGRGYLAARSAASYDDTLVIPLEIAKVFMDERTGEIYPPILEKLRLDLGQVFSKVAAFFTREHTRR